MKSLSLPTVETSRDFYLGGLYAVVLFLLIAMIFFQILQGLDKIHSYALKKSDRITVTLSDEVYKTSNVQQTTKPLPQPKSEPKSAPKESVAPPQDISSLFSEVKTQKVVHKKRAPSKKKIDSKRLAALQKRIKTVKKRTPSATAQKVKSLSLVHPPKTAGGKTASGGAEVDAYYAKIQATIYNNFFPPSNSQGSVAKIRIRITADGRLAGYKVLRRSGEPFFDQEVAQLGERLKQVRFEPNPKGKETVLDVSLISKE